jgi:Holliday junction resolvasome RuvABC endonuclease subunit
MRLLGIDSGEHLGWCILEQHPRELRYNVATIKDRTSLARLASSFIHEVKPDFIVVEGKFRRRIERMSGKALETMEFRAYAWAVMSSYHGIDCEMVAPKTWQSYYKIGTQKNRAEVGEFYTNLARRIVGNDTVPSDAAAAILICLYGEVLLKTKNLKGSPL